jgi:hypothetical protein
VAGGVGAAWWGTSAARDGRMNSGGAGWTTERWAMHGRDAGRTTEGGTVPEVWKGDWDRRRRRRGDWDKRRGGSRRISGGADGRGTREARGEPEGVVGLAAGRTDVGLERRGANRMHGRTQGRTYGGANESTIGFFLLFILFRSRDRDIVFYFGKIKRGVVADSNCVCKPILLGELLLQEHMAATEWLSCFTRTTWRTISWLPRIFF